MSYHDALNYLAQKTSVIELYNQWGGRAVVCPEWNGRILTSTCDGLDGNSFGFVNVQAIDTEQFENLGGEDQWTVSPLLHSFTVESVKENKAVLFRSLSMTDANGVPVDIHLSRSIFLLSRQKIGIWFGNAVADALEQEYVSAVGFRAENTVRVQQKAHIASRQRGMFNASPHTTVLVSMVPEGFTPEPIPVEIDYLGRSPHGRIRHLPQTLLIRGDGQGRCQVTMPFSFTPPIFGAVELRGGVLTLWTFDMPNGHKEDIVRIYNSGRVHGGESDWATYYEMNSFSSARELLPEHSLTYCQCTLHISADNGVLDDIIRQIFNVSLEAIKSRFCD